MSFQMKTNIKLAGIFFIVSGLLLIGFTFNRIHAGFGSYKTSKHGDPEIGVERDPELPRGNCSQCHLQHDGDDPNDFGLFLPDDNGLCQSTGCHEYEYQWPPGDYYWSYPGNVPEWYYSGHGASTSSFPPGSTREVRLCVQCHNPHAVADSSFGSYPSATSYLEERGCYSNTGLPGDGCHGLNGSSRPFGAADIYSQMLKSSKHNAEAQAKKHASDWSSSYPYGREARTTNSGFFSGANRHVECVDCHNPHEAIPGERVPGSNNITGPLLGSWGVNPLNGGAWSIPTTFEVVDFISLSSSREYQVCFKCHCYFAFGENPPTGYTDIAREFNPANASHHPVEDYTSTNSYTSPSPTNGFLETMEPPWDNGQHDLMRCSDCHASETDTDPRGPHGSNHPYILVASPASTEIEFCTGCHKASVYAPDRPPGRDEETGSRFDEQTTGDHQASHWYHAAGGRCGCRQCHGARQNPPPPSPRRRNPYPTELGSAHGTNTFPGLLNGANIYSYSPGSCWPTCHERESYNAGPE